MYPPHHALQVPILFGVVASVCTPLLTLTQQLPTFLAKQCWELLRCFHVALNRTLSSHFLAFFYRVLRLRLSILLPFSQYRYFYATICNYWQCTLYVCICIPPEVIKGATAILGPTYCWFLLLEVFFPGTPLSPSPRKPKLQISINCVEGKVAASYSTFLFFFSMFSTSSERTENLIRYKQ